MFLAKRVKLMEKVLDDGLNDLTTPADRLAILTRLEAMLRDLAQKAHINASDSTAANDELSRPVLTPSNNRFTVTQEKNVKTTFQFETGPASVIEVKPTEQPSTEDELAEEPVDPVEETKLFIR